MNPNTKGTIPNLSSTGAIQDAARVKTAKAQLANVLSELQKKQENPFIGTILAELTDQIRQMRETYGLGYLKIAEQLNSLKIEPKIVTSEQEIRKFCKIAFEKPRKPRRGKAADSAA
ncbi:hypothetical protein AW736_26375 [Termitidicoccus mucosus]|uniref:Uncharacterized protein n=1 Tax=Termitidicoccus mucosus TaxID=1184151 RepID=A0A178IR74_9BACT|nr:hypothetical protein AW736_26375 [Opitutaceae bacterium TSB47]